MVFRRRDTRPLTRLAVEMVYPKGGWRRAAHYILHRLRRLPDSPERIARGFFAGVFISFTPLFGFHFIGAALIAWAYRGNIIAALLGTFVGNPLTTPIMATMSLETGYWLLGEGYRLPLPEVFRAFGEAAAQLSRNVIAFLTGGGTEWDQLAHFFRRVYLPFLIGSPIPGTLVGLIFQFGSLPLIRAYQRLRARKAKERIERRSAELQRNPAPAPQSGEAAPPPEPAVGARKAANSSSAAPLRREPGPAPSPKAQPGIERGD